MYFQLIANIISCLYICTYKCLGLFRKGGGYLRNSIFEYLLNWKIAEIISKQSNNNNIYFVYKTNLNKILIYEANKMQIKSRNFQHSLTTEIVFSLENLHRFSIILLNNAYLKLFNKDQIGICYKFQLFFMLWMLIVVGAVNVHI